MNKSPSKKKTFKLSLFLISIALLVIIVGGYEFVKSRVPQMSGELRLKNLSSSVEVVRDINGIPHITAHNNRDAFRALGFIMAGERLFQMEVSRRLAQGELAEIFGDKALASDKLFRNLGLKSESERLIKKKLSENSFDPEMMAEIGAYYDGVNQFIETGAMPLEFILLGIKPRPFSMLDGQSFLGLMGFSFGVAIMNEPLLSKLAKSLGQDLVEDLRNEKIPGSNTRTVHTDTSIHKATLKAISFLEGGFNLFEGSNGWLLSGKRSVNGAPILSNDPHISYSNPGIWFEAHIKTPTYESYGHFLSLIPFPILSHNKERAWGLTMSLTDDMDIYRENIDFSKETYLFKGAPKTLTKRDEIIKVKNSTDFKMTVYKTHHGPILDHALSETTKEKSLALQWAFYDENNDPFTSIFKMGRARDMTEFKAAVSTGKAPGLNVLYADKENIGWWIFGEIWQKRPGLKTDFILNGESGEDEILSSLSFDKKPHLENPKNGVIVSANSRPEGYPKDLRGDWQPDDRYKTIESVLSQKAKWSPEELMELQSLNMNFENKILVKALIQDTHFSLPSEAKTYQRFLDVLKNWNLASEIHGAAPAIYYSWIREIQKLLLVDLTEDEKEIFAKTPNGWRFFKRVVLESDSAWWKKYNREDIFREAFKKTIFDLEKKLGNNMGNWHWGALHSLELAHPLGKMKPLDKIFNLGPYPISGATHEVNNQKSSSFKGDFQVKAGPSTRRIIDFSHPDVSWGVLPSGNSGHLLSPFYKNQINLFLEGKYREQWLVVPEKNVRFKLLMTPVAL